MESSVIAANRSMHDGGGLFLVNAGTAGSTMTVDLVACTITQNTIFNPAVLPPGSYAPGGGGLELGDSRQPLVVNFVDTILWGNLIRGAGTGRDIFEADVFPTNFNTLNVSHSDVGDVALHGATLNDLSGNLNVDPAFANVPHLGAGSPLIDAGSCASTPTTDFEGDPRPSGGTCDVGADEVP